MITRKKHECPYDLCDIQLVLDPLSSIGELLFHSHDEERVQRVDYGGAHLRTAEDPIGRMPLEADRAQLVPTPRVLAVSIPCVSHHLPQENMGVQQLKKHCSVASLSDEYEGNSTPKTNGLYKIQTNSIFMSDPQ